MAHFYKIKSLKIFGILMISIVATRVTFLILIHHVFMVVSVIKKIKKQTTNKTHTVFLDPFSSLEPQAWITFI